MSNTKQKTISKYEEFRNNYFGTTNCDVANSNTKEGNDKVAYLHELLKEPYFKFLFRGYQHTSAKVLFEKSIELAKMIEDGKIAKDKIVIVEADMTLRIAAIKEDVKKSEPEMTM